MSPSLQTTHSQFSRANLWYWRWNQGSPCIPGKCPTTELHCLPPFYGLFKDKVLLYSQGWPWIHNHLAFSHSSAEIKDMLTTTGYYYPPPPPPFIFNQSHRSRGPGSGRAKCPVVCGIWSWLNTEILGGSSSREARKMSLSHLTEPRRGHSSSGKKLWSPGHESKAADPLPRGLSSL